MPRTSLTLPFLSCALLACSGAAERSEPSFVEVVATGEGAMDAEFSNDGSRLFVLYLVGGELRFGSVDLEASERRIQEVGAVLVGGEPTLGGQDTIDLAVRPDSDELWLFANGKISNLNPNTAAAEIRVEIGSGATRGAIGFFGKDLLITGIVGLAKYTLNGAMLGAAQSIPGHEGVEFCEVGRSGETIWARGCAGAKAFARLDGAIDLGPNPGESGEEGIVRLLGGPVAVNDTHALALSGQGYCVREVLPTGGAQSMPNGTGLNDAGECGKVDVPITTDLRRAAMSPAGLDWVLPVVGGVVVVHPDAPPSQVDDIEGTWCGFDAQATLLTVNDGVLVHSNIQNGIDRLFREIRVDGGGIERTVSYVDPDPQIAENITDAEHGYWWKRSGNTLIVYGPTSEDEADTRVNAGYSGFNGIYRRAMTNDCAILAP